MSRLLPQIIAGYPLTSSPIEDVSPAAEWEEIPAIQRTASPEEHAPPVPPKSPSPWKGKGRATLDVHDVSDEEDLQSPVHIQQNAGPRSSDPFRETFDIEESNRYPPAANEVLEERKVVENLKRWEEIEKERRRAARENRASITKGSSTTSPQRMDVTRRGSLFWSSGRNGSPRRRPAPGSHPLPNDSEISRGTGLDEEEDDDDEDEDPRITPTRVRHTTSGSQDSHISDSSVSTITPHSHITPAADGGAPRTRHSAENPFTDKAAEKPFHGKPRAKQQIVPSSGRPLRYPTPKPLGLPLTGRRPPTHVKPMQSTLDSSDSLSANAKTFDEDAETGRWWTDWLCGCREGPDRGGDHQAGRTNPFE